MKQNGMSPLGKRMLALFAVALIAVLGCALTVRHASNKLTRGLTQLVPDRSVTDARQELTGEPDPRENELLISQTTTQATTEPPAATTTTDAPKTTAAPTAAAAAQIQNTTFRLPLDGTVVAKDYAPTVPVKSKTMGDWRIHSGIDFAAKEGDSVYAVGNGVVTKVASDDRWGYVIEVDHGAFTARYCAVEQDGAVPIGKVLAAGDVIGTVAVSPIEQADGCHLHFECCRNGEAIDPMDVLDTDN